MTLDTQKNQNAFATTLDIMPSKSMASSAHMSTGRDCRSKDDLTPVAAQNLMCAWRAAHITDRDETTIVSVDMDACRVIKVEKLSSSCLVGCLGKTHAEIPLYGSQIHDSNGDTGFSISNVMSVSDTILLSVSINGMTILYPKNCSAQACATLSTFILKTACVPLDLIFGLVAHARLPPTCRPSDRVSVRYCRGDPGITAHPFYRVRAPTTLSFIVKFVRLEILT